jgi:hypothetical protein
VTGSGLLFRISKESMMGAVHFKASGMPSRMLSPLLFLIVYPLMRNDGCLLDFMLRGSRSTWKERRENLFDVLAMVGIVRGTA